MLKPFCGAVLAVSSLIILGGCGSSTGPNHFTPAQIARHFDSLETATSVTSPRYPLLYVAEFGPAYGVAPTEVQVTTGSGAHTWQGYMWSGASLSAPGDTEYEIVVYSDYALTDVLLAEINLSNTGRVSSAFAEMVADTVFLYQGSGSGTGALGSIGAPCALTPGLANITVQPHTGCVLATFTGSLTWSFPGANPEFRTISIGSQTFAGLTWQ